MRNGYGIVEHMLLVVGFRYNYFVRHDVTCSDTPRLIMLKLYSVGTKEPPPPPQSIGSLYFLRRRIPITRYTEARKRVYCRLALHV